MLLDIQFSPRVCEWMVLIHDFIRPLIGMFCQILSQTFSTLSADAAAEVSLSPSNSLKSLMLVRPCFVGLSPPLKGRSDGGVDV